MAKRDQLAGDGEIGAGEGDRMNDGRQGNDGRQ